ncbi:MAG: hypothetical protein ACKVT0_08280, partial [Planctomycetaceae bacterium]
SVFGLKNNMTNSKIKTTRFALCLNNEGYKSSLDVGKLYRIVSDKDAEAHGYLRVVDESGEDYAFTMDRFHIMTLPSSVEKTLLTAVRV